MAIWKFLILVLENLYNHFSLIALITVLVSYFVWVNRENLPPGPIGLPFVGYLPFLGREGYLTLHRLTKIYGPIYSFYLGSKLVVVLGNFKVVEEALTNNKIMDRPKDPPNHLLPNSLSLSISNGKIWKEQRQFSVQLLRQLGMAKQSMEDQITNEIQKLLSEIDKAEGKCMNLGDLLYSSVSNNVLSLLIGRPLDYHDDDRIFLNKLLQTMTLFFRPTRIHAYFPWTRKWMAKWKIWGYDRAEDFMQKLSNFIERQIEYHKKNIDFQNTTNYIEGYLKFMESKKEKYSSFTEKMLKGNFQSLFSAGSTPSRASLEWCIQSMVLYPDIQKLVHQEIDDVLGKEKQPVWSDHVNMPYTMAVIFEAMRQNTIVPISMLRCTSARTKISGYDIPKEAIIMTNIWGVHHDQDSWEDPFTFKPERFIRDGKLFRPQEFIPFSYGKRNCPGEDMALITVFLYFTSLMQRYTISLPNRETQIKEVLGIARLLILDNIHLTPRK